MGRKEGIEKEENGKKSNEGESVNKMEEVDNEGIKMKKKGRKKKEI